MVCATPFGERAIEMTLNAAFAIPNGFAVADEDELGQMRVPSYLSPWTLSGAHLTLLNLGPGTRPGQRLHWRQLRRPTHVRHQHTRHRHTAVRILVVLQYRDERAPNGPDQSH